MTTTKKVSQFQLLEQMSEDSIIEMVWNFFNSTEYKEVANFAFRCYGQNNDTLEHLLYFYFGYICLSQFNEDEFYYTFSGFEPYGFELIDPDTTL